MSENESNPWAKLISSTNLVVLKVDRKKKSKSQRYDSPTSWMLGIVEERVLGGLSAGAERYSKKRKRSNEKRKEGALRDFSKNAMSAQAETAREFAKIPTDMIDMMEESSPKRWPWL